MSIQILPARLANQIAAGEVVERPASVVKELVENSLDAGATKIAIEIEKGGAKCIRISDNGKGIVKEELTLALSRHATSKIKDLSDLEAIASLGFRGEALASISSVARLTLTSKPVEQENAWQAYAQGRDMEVVIKPAAHPNGTTIEVHDLFFNTPARRKFLRTEKTEFNHIDEVIRRIALARFDVSFSLVHNGKMIRQYRAIKNQTQYAKRVAAVCGNKFIEHALEVNCTHDGLHLWGWIAKPDFHRSQNDLCYSYVNGRMMRDKLINHGIRQSYADLIPSDSYPAFVLFLDLDHREVDVNVHPAKHEVRFHQGRYVHDYIYSVCHQALQQDLASQQNVFADTENSSEWGEENELSAPQNKSSEHHNHSSVQQDYIRPLQRVSENKSGYAGYTAHDNRPVNSGYTGTSQKQDIVQAAAAYQQLMSPVAETQSSQNTKQASLESAETNAGQVVHVTDKSYAVIADGSRLMLTDLTKIAFAVNNRLIDQRWANGLVGQPLLLPVIVSVEKPQIEWLNAHMTLIEQAGIQIQVQASNKVQIRQFPSILRDRDVAGSLELLLDKMIEKQETEDELSKYFKTVLAQLTVPEAFDLNTARQLWIQAQSVLQEKLIEVRDLNSCDVDLTSAISQLQ